jgi:hypothetical protein
VIADPAVALRARHPWEAIDLGALMLRRWAGTIAVLVAPFAAAAAAAIAFAPGELRLYGILAIWWLKPLIDRLVVVPVGVLLFSPRSKPRDIAKPLLRSLRLGLLADLSWRRLSPWRAYLLASRSFEGIRGPTRRRRNRELLAESRGWIVALTAILACAEWGIAFMTAIQLGSLLDTELFSIGKSGFATVLGIAYALSVAVVEPLFALSCFSLYLNRRTIAEGWDLELRFKRLASRQRGQSFLPLVLFLALAAAPVRAFAEPEVPEPSASEFSKRVESVLEDPVFGKDPRAVRKLELREGLARESPAKDEPYEAEPPGIFGKLSSETLRIAVAAAILALLVVVLAANSKRIGVLARLPSRRDGIPAAGSVGIALPLPETDLAESLRAAAELWRGGDPRGALAIAYRGAIGHGTRRLDWRLGDDATEGDCLREAARAGGDFSRAFSELASAWIRLAWGGRAPSDEEFAHLIDRVSLAAEARA